MLRLAADENLNNNIVRGLLYRKPDLDIVRVQDAGLTRARVTSWSTVGSSLRSNLPRRPVPTARKTQSHSPQTASPAPRADDHEQSP